MIVWSDEERFRLDGSNGFQSYWHHIRDELQYLKKKRKKKILRWLSFLLVWTAFHYSAKTSLAFIEGSINSKIINL